MQIISAQDIDHQFKVALVVSRFNEEITHLLYEGAIHRLKELDFAPDQVTVVSVPGAIEIPLTAQRLAQSKRFEAIVCLGAVIRGETTHYDYVCQQVSEGCLQVSLQYDIPVIFGILTTEDDEQAFERAGGKHGHKGRDAVDAAFEMVSVLRQL
ncbi:6,7-dimethyl-8-ribityllumazine synthase [soil metagenome]